MYGWSGCITRMTGCADRYHICLKKTTHKHFRVEKCNVPYSQQFLSTEPDVRDSVSFLWIVVQFDEGGVGRLQLLGVLGWVCSGISKLAEEQGLLSALTSPTAPGNALHSSSWQLLGHFQKGWGKNTAGLFSGAFGTREWREPKEWDWKHMAAWEYLWLSHLSFPPGFCSWNHIMEKRPTPTKRTLPFTLSKNDSSYELISFNTPAASANDFQVGTTCSRCSCFIC